jgi:hypothetical protein
MEVKEIITRLTGFDTNRQVLSAGGVIMEDHMTINDLSLNRAQLESEFFAPRNNKNQSHAVKPNLNLHVAEGKFNLLINVVGPVKTTNKVEVFVSSCTTY